MGTKQKIFYIVVDPQLMEFCISVIHIFLIFSVFQILDHGVLVVPS